MCAPEVSSRKWHSLLYFQKEFLSSPTKSLPLPLMHVYQRARQTTTLTVPQCRSLVCNLMPAPVKLRLQQVPFTKSHSPSALSLQVTRKVSRTYPGQYRLSNHSPWLAVDSWPSFIEVNYQISERKGTFNRFPPLYFVTYYFSLTLKHFICTSEFFMYHTLRHLLSIHTSTFTSFELEAPAKDYALQKTNTGTIKWRLSLPASWY